MLLVCFLGVRPGPGEDCTGGDLQPARAGVGCAGRARMESGGAPAARTASANCRCGAADELPQSGFGGNSSTARGADYRWRRAVNRGFRRRDGELPVWPRESGLPKWGSSPRVFKETWDAWRRGCAAGAAPEGGSGSNEGENVSRRSAGRLRGFGALRMGTREVSVPAVSMARRCVDRLRAANIAAAPWKFARKSARPPSCVRVTWIQSESFRPYCFPVRAGGGYGRRFWAIRGAPARFGRALG